MHTTLRSNLAASQQQPSPFIVASPLSSPSHAAPVPRGATTNTTEIHMDSADELEHEAEMLDSEHAAEPLGTPRRYPREHDVAASAALERPRPQSLSDAAGVAGQGGSSATSPPPAPRSSLSTYQLASAALRRLPTRPAPSAAGVVASTVADERTHSHSSLDDEAAFGETQTGRSHRSIAQTASSSHAAPAPPLWNSSAAHNSGHAQQSALPSPATRRAAISPGRFQVPPPVQPPSSPTAAAHHSSSPHEHPSPPLPSRLTRSSADATRSRTSSRSESGAEADDGVDYEDDEVEEDVAARVLSSLQQKDAVIYQLTRAVSTLEKENEALRCVAASPSRASTAVTSNGRRTGVTDAATTPPRATAQALFHSATLSPTPEGQRALNGSPGTAEKRDALSRSPSQPTTPLRWWKQHPKASRAQGEATEALRGSPLKSRKLSSPSHSLAAAHAAVDTVAALQEALAEKEAELAEVKAQLSRTGSGDVFKKPSQLVSPGSHAAVSTDSDGAGDGALHPGTSVGGGAPVVEGALEAARDRVAQLEYQLETLQEEKREDQLTMREHIAHLTRELRGERKETRRQERQHKLELAGLQREVAALADQLEHQFRAAMATSASPSSHQEVLQQQLAEARRRADAVLHEHTSAQRQWLQELEEQKRLLEETREAARASEAQVQAQAQHEVTLLQQLTQQQEDVEARVQQWKQGVSQAQKDLAELRAVHRGTEATVAIQRSEIQELTEALAAATLQHAHDEQRVEQLEAQGELLRQQLRQVEGELATERTRVEQLRQEAAEGVGHVLSEQDNVHRTLLKHVESCMKGSEAVESALLEAEASRHEVSAQLTRALAERDEYHRLLRENSLQAQTQALEQQQLFQEGQEALQQRLRDTQRSLVESNGALETTQRELHAATEKLQRLESEQREVLEEKEKAESRLRRVEASMEQQTAHLVEAKESLKEALQAQLSTANTLRRAEQQLRVLREAAHRAEERRTQEQHALQRLVKLLWNSELQKQHSATMTAMSHTALVPQSQRFQAHAHASQPLRGAHQKAKAKGTALEVAPTSEEDDAAGEGQQWCNESGDAAARQFASSSATRSSSSASSTAESVVMSAVSTADVVATTAHPSSIHGEANSEYENECSFAGRRTQHVDVGRPLPPPPPPPRDALFHHEAPTFRNTGRLMVATVDDASQLHPMTSTHKPTHTTVLVDQTERSALHGSREELYVMRTLCAIHDAVQRLLLAHSAVVRELSTKRTAVRTLVNERKAQQKALEKAQRALTEQQHEAERRKRETARVLRAEANAALEDLRGELEKRHALELEAKLEGEMHEHEKKQRQLQALCVSRVCAQLITFVKQLPGTLHASLSSLAMPVVVEHTKEDADLPPPADPVTVATSSLFLQTSASPEVQAECDQIARDVLGLAGGWSDLSAAAVVDSTTSMSPPTPPACMAVTRSGEHAPHDYVAAAVGREGAAFSLREPAVWPVKELAELQELLHVYLRPLFSLPVCASKRDETVATPTRVSDPKENAAPGVEGEEQLSVAMGLCQWMKSLRLSSAAAPASTPHRNVNAQGPQGATAASTVSASEPLACLLNECVAHVMQHVLLGGVVHVMDGLR
ncbi:hypothetical protein ABL78_3394 [Leptomonas seymouri]|uniref:Uncharacterized protein n=1 Tax=Leptomonas seymouri TaxID=5684 RepID=A0A0N0P6D7_LEPSE|nr:hypothetical protein ABL78_3394 [Leptomonas seymouri]|eukprot:KPI87516.1 hypothetical protein ABL78_3394 [Leptomonas seymouri]